MALLHRQDFYGATLSLVESYELGAWDRVDALAESLGIGTVDLPPMYLNALAWATEQQSSNTEVFAGGPKASGPAYSERSASAGSTRVARRPGR
jgi:hypothetical protein